MSVAVSESRLPHLSRGLLLTMTVASAVAVANIYYNQPMLADIGRTFHAAPREVGWVATATQIGYAMGMPAFIPLGDFIDRRRLVVLLFLAVSGALAFASLSPNVGTLAVASLLIGLTTVIAQVIIPLASELAGPAEQGKTIGSIMSGVLLGILLARTVSGTVARYFGWRAMFAGAAIVALVFSGLLRASLPKLHPSSKIRYGQLMRGIWDIVIELPKLRQVSFIAAMFFAAFSAFWTTLVFLLETPPYHYGSEAAGLFGLVGAVGAAVAPWAGRYADRRSPRFVVADRNRDRDCRLRCLLDKSNSSLGISGRSYLAGCRRAGSTGGQSKPDPESQVGSSQPGQHRLHGRLF